ncbi:hypothetical protein [Fredinandcohnia sp. 179-A 10B2 NHS]|uniref:hypothetical protein n=1 Tax=Fredinandcohnia sp. 179-A 10B2 NHS TaxID=3235176 RepID=UPI0039A053A6
MRKILLLVTLAFISIIAIGCGATETTPPQGNEQETHPYQLESLIYEVEGVKIQYPQLTKTQNKELEERINKQIADDVLLYANQYKSTEDMLEMNYQIMMQTSEIISILFLGEYNAGMYPTHLLFTTTVDLQEGEKIKLPVRVEINEEFIDRFLKSKYIDRESPESPNEEKQAAVIEYVKGIPRNDLIDAFKTADIPDMDQNVYGIYSYYTEDGMVISIQVPHALGDHAEFQFTDK